MLMNSKNFYYPYFLYARDVASYSVAWALSRPGAVYVVDVIVADGLTKRFDGLTAVDNVSFHVHEGEIFGFLGPNGAGKTTTVRMLTGILPPDAGRAFVLGFDVVKKPLEVKRRIGVVPEAANVYLDLTVWENVTFMAELYGVPRGVRERRARELLDEMGLLKYRDAKARRLSKGMRQRLLICMALVHEPPLLFLDEPTSGLDPQSARRIRSMLRELNKEEGVTIFLTTHNMWEAEELCHRIAIINRGRLVAVSNPRELKDMFTRLRTVEVEFNRAVDERSILEALGCEVDVSGNRCRIRARDVNDVICGIVDYAKSHGLEILSLNVIEPSLEDIFLEIVEGKADV